MKNHVLYFNQPHTIEIRQEAIPSPKKNEVLIKNFISAISAGTESLIYQGLIPDDMVIDSKILTLQQKITYPLKYGYSSVGQVIECGSKENQHLLNKWVFVFNPHQSFFCAEVNQIILLPEDILPNNAVFIPSLETAINLILDGAPLIGENVVVFGLGVVGLLTTALLRQFPINQLIAIDFHAARRSLANKLGVDLTVSPEQNDFQDLIIDYLAQSNQDKIDLIYELTGNPQAMNAAISLASFEAKIVLGSWYGKKTGSIHLGGKFHRHRIKMIASQVSTIASELQGRWNHQRRFEVVFNMLRKIAPQYLISHSFHITEAEQAYQLLTQNQKNSLQLVLTYEE